LDLALTDNCQEGGKKDRLGRGSVSAQKPENAPACLQRRSGEISMELGTSCSEEARGAGEEMR